MRGFALLLALMVGCGSEPRLDGTSWGTGEHGCCELLSFGADGHFTRSWTDPGDAPQAGAWMATGHQLTLAPVGLESYSAMWGIDSDDVLTILWARPLSYWRRPAP